MGEDDVRRTQLAENMRFFNDLRFKQLSLLMGGMTIVGAGVAQYPSVTIAGTTSFRSVLAFAGMLFTAVMWVMEVRSTMHFIAVREHAPDLWPVPIPRTLGWANKIFTTGGAVLLLHVIFYWFWFWCSTQWYPYRLLIAVFLAMGTALTLFSTLTYWSLGSYARRQGNSASSNSRRST